MCIRRKKKPIRLEKKEPSKYSLYLQFCKYIVKQPEFWLTVILICVFVFVVIIALKESGTYLVYNRGL